MIDYSEFVQTLVKPGDDIVQAMDGHDAHIMHMSIGVCGEAGELLDAIKAAVIYRKELDRENVIEELGDLEFFLEGLREALSITREETLDHNIRKLNKRYKKKRYSDEAAQARADKAEDFEEESAIDLKADREERERDL